MSDSDVSTGDKPLPLRARIKLAAALIGLGGLLIAGIALARLEALPKRGVLKSISDQAVHERIQRHKEWLSLKGCEPDDKGEINPETVKGPSVKQPDNAEQASFFATKLPKFDFSGLDLRCASFIGADVSGASFSASDLRGALFTRADLSDASFIHSDLRGTIFNWSQMRGVVLEPSYGPLPQGIAYAYGLDQLTSTDTPTHLVALKKAFGEAGYVSKRKDIIAAINRWNAPLDSAQPLANCMAAIVGAARFVLFDLTCEFGSNPTRPLLLMAASWLMFVVIYWLVIATSGRSVLFLFLKQVGGERKRVVALPRSAGLDAVRLASLFSARNVVRLGFGQLDLGVWLRMLQRHDYDVAAAGWMRTLSAAQALFSQYMIALAVLSAFGTPFDV
jgi:hypothetical protein